ncbi:phage tail assembly chaperone G [Clostridium sporogenes]
MEITLKIDDKDKTFVAPFIGARMLRKSFALSNKINEVGIDESIIDDVAMYLVNIYGQQFTIDELYDGFPAQEFFTKAFEDLNVVIGGFEEKVKN